MNHFDYPIHTSLGEGVNYKVNAIKHIAYVCNAGHKNGGDDETRTRDLRRDRPAFYTKLNYVPAGYCVSFIGIAIIIWWAGQGLNLRPPACKADALPAELPARLTMINVAIRFLFNEQYKL